MQALPPAKWQQYLQRISHRYAGQLVTLRQREDAREEPQVVLWRTPLHYLSTNGNEEATEIVVAAGTEEPFIEIRIGPVQSLSVMLAPNQALERLHFHNADGTSATLLFNA
jgi:hypothetical protein